MYVVWVYMCVVGVCGVGEHVCNVGVSTCMFVLSRLCVFLVPLVCMSYVYLCGVGVVWYVFCV